MAERSEQIKYVLNRAREHDVKFIRLWFTDILGNIRYYPYPTIIYKVALNKHLQSTTNQ